MAGMSRNNSTTALQGFSVFQPALGAPLQFLPALGTPELDALVDAFLPGPASLKDKRATICMDFCEYARQTGETFKFYAAYNPYGSSATATTATDSPASSSAMHDSGYGSSFNVSPVVSDVNLWSQPATTSPSFAAASRQSSRSGGRPAAERKQSTSFSSRAATSDFSHLPGMKIMTKDGQDVTNSASRGCKTKEQRDHAHLMRIIKACDACRRKKIRCDPSHKKRTVSQTQPAPEPKAAKKARKTTAERSPSASPAAATAAAAAAAAAAASSTSHPVEAPPDFFAFADPFTDFADEGWEQFVRFDEESASAAPADVIPPDYDFFLDPAGYFSPSTATSTTSPSAPFTPAPPGPTRVDAPGAPLMAELLEGGGQQPVLPYLTSGGHHGSNYLDFNLYSPDTGFLDEEPQLLQTNRKSLGLNAHASSSRQRASGVLAVQDNADASAHVSSPLLHQTGQLSQLGSSGVLSFAESHANAASPVSGTSRQRLPQLNTANLSEAHTRQLEVLRPLSELSSGADAMEATAYLPRPRPQSDQRWTRTQDSSGDENKRRNTSTDIAFHVATSHSTQAQGLSLSPSANAAHANATSASPGLHLRLQLQQHRLKRCGKDAPAPNDRPGIEAVGSHVLQGPAQTQALATAATRAQSTALSHGEVYRTATAGLLPSSPSTASASGLIRAGYTSLQQACRACDGTASWQRAGLQGVVALARPSLLLNNPPVRQLVGGTGSSSLSSLLFFALAGFSIVSLLAVCLSSSSSPPTGVLSALSARLPVIALSLAPLAIGDHASSLSASSPSPPSPSLSSAACKARDNVKPKIQAARPSRAIHALPCAVSRRVARSLLPSAVLSALG